MQDLNEPGILPLSPTVERLSCVPYSELTIQSEIGRGSFGVVKFGFWRQTPVAIKLQTDIATATHEAEIHKSLNHANIVLLLAISRSPSKFCLILEKMDMDVWDYLSHSKKPFDTKVHIAVETARAVEYLHTEAKLIHRDIKIENIFMRGKEVKLGDFGLAVKISDREKSPVQGIIGPWSSCPPEYLNRPNEGKYINKAGVEYTTQFDIYAFAILLYLLITQENAYSASTDAQIISTLARVKAGSRPTINFISPLTPIMRKCWAQAPDARPTSTELLNMLLLIPTQNNIICVKTNNVSLQDGQENIPNTALNCMKLR